ncbi:hypothetical protein [Methanobrevibacter sp.]|uniref:hypothetical protein n=1 Tax=Methanobrevibacter sp. TaxID=66852 RepID=UPI00388D9066
MTSIVKTKEVIEDANIVSNNARVYVMRKKDAKSTLVDWKNKKEIHWSKYQIKESDMRAKTATFTSPQYLDLTTGTYCVLITSTMHESFGGIILNVEYDEDTGLYNYQCQDFSRLYQSKVDIISVKKSLHRVLKYLITRGGVTLIGAVSKTKLKQYEKMLSGLRPAHQYEQKYYGSITNFNPMTQKNQMIIRDKSWIEIIRDLVYGTGAYIDVYFDIYGVLHIQPYHKKDWLETGLHLTAPEIASADHKFDTTNIITGVIVKSTDKTNVGKYYGAQEMVNLDLTAFFGQITTTVDNPNQSTSSSSSSKSSSSKKSTTATKTSNPYGTKKKVVWLSIDTIDGKTSDMKKMNDMKALLQKRGWEVHVTSVGPSYHYLNREKCKKGVWFVLFGGFCAGSLRELGESSWFLNPLKKNKSRVVVGFFPPAQTGILKGGKYYKHLGPAHDWEGSQSYAHLDYPAKWMSQHGVPWMFGKNAKEMVAKFLAGGDNYKTTGSYYKYYDSWTKHDVKWIK